MTNSLATFPPDTGIHCLGLIRNLATYFPCNCELAFPRVPAVLLSLSGLLTLLVQETRSSQRERVRAHFKDADTRLNRPDML
ncbi:unnamed protein product [Heligmosomoides polygyrus]|uniref:Uncharacterized protein n=1 Tax=Heligmosomoides polygyrus TaxID=6339 RepID=A0A183F7Z1_HELPZ|nr:unnamed protein product [Heligmosomoides polygyrus]